MSKPKYWKRLKAQPGVPIAMTASIIPLAAGLLGEWESGALGAVVFVVVCWVPVLWAARTQPVSGGE